MDVAPLDVRDELDALLSRLPDRLQLAVRLRWLEELPWERVACALGRDPASRRGTGRISAVRAQQLGHRGLQRMRSWARGVEVGRPC